MRGRGPCGRPVRMRRTHGRPPSRHGGQPQGPQPRGTPPLPLRDAPRHGKHLPLRVDALGVEQAVLVPHDASGPVAINWALDHPERVSALVLLNTYYADAPTLRFPEFISLFADPAYAALTRALAQEPTVARWLLTWQGGQFGAGEQGQETLLPMVLPQFADTPSTFPAF